MKIRNLIFYIFFTAVVIFTTGCNVFKGGKNCDCPKFGQTASLNTTSDAY